jgi:phospholipid-binding lipoprotein MlaA
MRSAGLLFGVLAVALSGCSPLGPGLRSESAVLAGASPRVETADPSGAEAGPTGAVTVVTGSPAFVPVSFEPIRAEQAPPALIAYIEPLVSQRGIPAPPPDPSIEEYDPWEPFNEKMFSFNKYVLDDFLLKPAAKGYNFVVPDMFQQMIDNGFSNIRTVPRLVNSLLQARFSAAGRELARFLINSTLGVGGLFDIARQEFNLQKVRADFGQTLGVWGSGPGPYLVLPFLPPMTVRDGIGLAVDGALDPLSYFVPFIWERFGMKVGDTVNDRSLNLDFYEGIEETTVDLYSAVRNAYLQRRIKLISDAKAESGGEGDDTPLDARLDLGVRLELTGLEQGE